MGGWIDAIEITRTEISSYWYLAIATTILLTLIFFVARKSTTATPQRCETNRQWAILSRMLVVGVVLICLGYLPFIFNIMYMTVSQRTFLHTAPGATLFFLALFLIVDRCTKIVTAALTAVLIFTGLAAQLFQFQHYIEISKKQQFVLKDIVHNFDGNATNKALVILDYSNTLNHDWMFLTPNFVETLYYLYGKPVDTVEVCYMPSHEWQQPDPLMRNGTCEETSEGWTFNFPTSVSGRDVEPSTQQPSKKLSKPDVITVAVGRAETTPASPKLEAYRRDLASNPLPMSARFRGITETTPGFNFFKFSRQEHNDEYFWDFGTWWSLDVPIAGSGWRNTEWEHSGLSDTSSAWKNASRASLYLDLTPTPGDYFISGLFAAFTSEKFAMKCRSW